MSVEMLGQSPHRFGSSTASAVSPATRAGDFIFVSGQVPTDDDGQIVAGGIEAQTRQVFKRLEEVLGAGRLHARRCLQGRRLAGTTRAISEASIASTWNASAATAPHARQWRRA